MPRNLLPQRLKPVILLQTTAGLKGLLHPVLGHSKEKNGLARSLSALWLFLALFGEFLPAFFSMDENIVGIAQFLVARVPDFAKPVQVVRFDAVEDVQHFFVDFRLQFLRERLMQPDKFRPEDPDSLQFAAGIHDPRQHNIRKVVLPQIPKDAQKDRRVETQLSAK